MRRSLIMWTCVLCPAITACDDDGGTTSDTTPADTTSDTTPTDTTPVDTTSDTTPADTTSDTTPADTTPVDTTPGDTTPADTVQIGNGAAIAKARGAVDNAGDLPVAFDDVLVSFVRGERGTGDRAGFFIQDDPTGPAFLVVDDGTSCNDCNTTALPAADVCVSGTCIGQGDRVSFSVTAVTESNGIPMGSAISGVTVESSGHSVARLVQDLNAVDITSSYDSYAQELIKVTGKITETFGFAGNGHESAAIDAGTNVEAADMKLRMPTPLVASTGADFGCAFSLSGTPLLGFERGDGSVEVQPSAFTADDIVVTCAVPRVTEVIGLTANSVAISFNVGIDEDSVIDPATQFTFDGGLTATAAIVYGGHVLVATTDQTPGTTYTATVAASVEDPRGQGVGSTNSGTFSGWSADARQLVINEVDYDQTGTDTQEFVEIYNAGTTAASLVDVELQMFNGSPSDKTPVVWRLALSEAGATLAAGGYIVVHQSGFDPTVPQGVSKLEAPGGLENGPDGVRLVDASTGIVIDAVSYAGDVIGAGEGGGTTLDDGPASSLVRCPNGVDTHDNAADFGLVDVATPGSDNPCLCTVAMDASCPDTTTECGASFSGGSGCVVEGLGNCYDSGVKGYKLQSGETVTISFATPIHQVEVFFALQGSSGSGTMTFKDKDDVTVDTLATNGDCSGATMPDRQVLTFDTPVESVDVTTTGSTAWLDTLIISQWTK